MLFSTDSFKNPALYSGKNFASVSTKLTTANWSPDHTSRAPTPVQSEPANPVNPIIPKIHQNIDKLNIHLKYFKDLSIQLKTSLDSEINKLNIKKLQILAEIELKFSENIRQLKLIFSEKSCKLTKSIREISKEINKNLELIEDISNGNQVDEDFIEHLIKFSVKDKEFDNNWLKIRENEVKFNEAFNDKDQALKKVFISTLQSDSRNAADNGMKLRVYVPFGQPPCSFYYLVKVENWMKVEDLARALKDISGFERELRIFVKWSLDNEEVMMRFGDKLPGVIRGSWPRLFVKFNSS